MLKRNGIPNDNQNIILLLSKNFAQSRKARNRILFISVMLSIVTITMVFGISWGKIKAEEIRFVRENGTTASGTVEKGNIKQYESLKALDYIKCVGRCVSVGSAKGLPNSENKGDVESVCRMMWVDFTAWDKLLSPAYTDIYGSYPVEKQEIMLSRKTLEMLNIKEPRQGMSISLNVSIGLFMHSEETFRLSGWYTDYCNEKSAGYISQKKLQDWGISIKEVNLLFQQSNHLNWQETEEKLYKELPIRNGEQKITVSDTAQYHALTGIMGGYEMALTGTFIVLCGVYFLVHNVLQISMAEDIQKLGLLNAIGATQKQLTKIYRSQILHILFMGTITGGVLSIILLIGVIPIILGNQFLNEMGGAANLRFFQPLILVIAIVFTNVILLAATDSVIRKTVNLSCVESTVYIENVNSKSWKYLHNAKKKFRLKNNKRSAVGEIWYMAWRYVSGNKNRFLLTVFSLFLGLAAFLSTVVITTGSDYAYVIEKRPDFLVAGQFSSFGHEQGYGMEYQTRDVGEDPLLTEGNYFALLYDNDYDEFSPISAEVREKLMGIDGIDVKNFYVTEGAYLYTIISRKGIRPFAESDKEVDENDMVEGWDQDVVQILKENEIKELRNYVEKYQLEIDMDSFENGTGVLILHDHALSVGQQKLAEDSIGEPLYFKTMLSKEDKIHSNHMKEEERTEQEEKGYFRQKQSETFKLCGYLDKCMDDFPQIRQTWHGAEGELYFLISESGFQKIPTEKKTLSMELNAEPGREPIVKSKIQKIISEENYRRSKLTETAFEEGSSEAGIFSICKSDLMKQASAYIRGNRIILGIVSMILLMAGLTNYFNVVITGMYARRKELEIMESIGMTEKQKMMMIFGEGSYYCLFTVGLLLTVGIGVLISIRYYMEQKLSYFVFCWPVSWILLIIACFIGINVLTARRIYGRL